MKALKIDTALPYKQACTCVIVSVSSTLTGHGWTSTPFFTSTVRVWEKEMTCHKWISDSAADQCDVCYSGYHWAIFNVLPQQVTVIERSFGFSRHSIHRPFVHLILYGSVEHVERLSRHLLIDKKSSDRVANIMHGCFIPNTETISRFLIGSNSQHSKRNVSISGYTLLKCELTIMAKEKWTTPQWFYWDVVRDLVRWDRQWDRARETVTFRKE